VKIIDFHTHCFPDALAARAIAVLIANSRQTPRYDGTAGGLRAYEKARGISKAVVCNIATNAKQTQNVNTFAISLLEMRFKGQNMPLDARNIGAGKDTETGAAVINAVSESNNESVSLIPFGSIHPEFADYKSEIDRLHSAGIKGLKFHPDYQAYFVDDPHMMDVYGYAASLGMILLFHTGLDIGLRSVVRCTPDRLINVVKALAGAKIVAAHMGGYKYADLTEEYLIGQNLYFDTSASLSTLPKKQALRMIRNHGADKILFATDGPWFDAGKDIVYIKSLGLTAGEREAIFHGNAERLL